MYITICDRTVPVTMWNRDMPPISGGPDNMIASDTETEPIKDKVNFPDSVMAQFCNGVEVHIVMWQDLPIYLHRVSEANPGVRWAFHNLPYEAGIYEYPDWLLEAIEKGMVIDTGMRWQLRNLATSGDLRADEYPSLDQVTKDLLSFELNKDENIRLGFRRDKVPDEASVKYAAEDALATWIDAFTMGPQRTEDIQVKAMLPLDRISRNGMLIDREQFGKISKKLTGEFDEASATLQDVWDLPIGKKKDLTGPQQMGQIKEVLGMELDEDKLKIAPLSYLLYVAYSCAGDMDKMRQHFPHSYKMCFDEDFVKTIKREDCNTFVSNELNLLDPPVNKKGFVTFTKKTTMHLMYRLVSYTADNLPFNEIKETIADEYEECLGWNSDYKQKGINTILQENMLEIEQTMGVKFERTKTGAISTSEEALSKYDVDHPFLNLYKRYKHLEKMIGTYLNWDTVSADGRVHPRYLVLKRTGRTSCRGPNHQNLPREPGIREIYHAPEGWVLVSIDYNQLELCTLAQDCYLRFGESRLGDMINKGIDVHAYLGGRLYGYIPEEIDISNAEEVAKLIALIKKLKADPEFKQCRNFAKVCNFGFPGGLSPKSFVSYAKGYDLVVTIDEADRARKEWLRTFPEMEKHLTAESMCNTLEEEEEQEFEKYVVTTYTGRVRNNTTFTAALNTKFQGTAADGAKLVMWELYKRPFYRMVAFIHDEIIFELPYDEHLTARIEHIQGIMERGMREIVPDVNIATEAAVSFNWIKKAEEVRDAQGNYVPWELREELGAKTS